MIESLTLVLAAPITKAILDKFYEGVGSKLGEKAVELVPDKVKQLGQLVWDKYLRGNQKADEIIQSAATGSEKSQIALTNHLHKILEADSALKQKAHSIAKEIIQVIQNNMDAKNIQQILGGQGLQVIEPQSQVIQTGDNNTFTFNTYNAPLKKE